MPFDSDYQPIPAPPPGRNWADDDVCVFHGCPSIQNLMKLPGFPRPLALYPTDRRLWRPQDHVDYRDALVTQMPFSVEDLPEIDIVAFRAKQRAKRARAERERDK